jgi:hypothetical protein
MFVDSVDESDSLNEVWDVLVATESSPAFRGALGQLEEHNE